MIDLKSIVSDSEVADLNGIASGKKKQRLSLKQLLALEEPTYICPSPGSHFLAIACINALIINTLSAWEDRIAPEGLETLLIYLFEFAPCIPSIDPLLFYKKDEQLNLEVQSYLCINWRLHVILRSRVPIK